MWDSLRRKFILTAHRSGIAYVLALITLIVVCMLAMALMRSVGSAHLQRRSTVEEGVALHLADAGIRYGYWLYRYCAQNPPFEQALTLDSGTTTIKVTDNSDSLRDSVRIEATGKHDEVTASRYRVVAKRSRPFEMALCVDDSVMASITLIVTGGSYQDTVIWINGKLDVSKLEVEGRIAASDIDANIMQVTGQERTTDGYIVFPNIDLSYYDAAKDRYLPGGAALSSLEFEKDLEVVYVNGDLTLKGEVEGKGVLVVKGDLDVTDDVEYKDGDSFSNKLVVLAAGDIDVASKVDRLAGFYYSQGKFKAESHLTFTCGGLATSKIQKSQNMEITLDRDFQTTDLPYRMRLPGYETAATF